MDDPPPDWRVARQQEQPDGTYLVEIGAPRLQVTARTIPADGSSHVVCRYASIEPVYFVVAGEVVIKEPVDGWAELSVAASQPGAIRVEVEDHATTIIATTPDA